MNNLKPEKNYEDIKKEKSIKETENRKIKMYKRKGKRRPRPENKE